MRIVFPKTKTRILRQNLTTGYSLAVRKVNQYPTYFVTDESDHIVAIGKRKHCVEVFNKNTLHGDKMLEHGFVVS